MSGCRAFSGPLCEDGYNHKYTELTDLCWRVMGSTLDAVVGVIRTIPLLVYFLVMYWFYLIKSFIKIVRNANSDLTVLRLVNGFILITLIVAFHTILVRCVQMFYGPLLYSVVFVFRNITRVYNVLRAYEDF